MTPPDRTTTHGASRFSGSQNPGECARNKPELTAMGTAKTAMEIAPLGAELRHVADADPDVQVSTIALFDGAPSTLFEGVPSSRSDTL